MAGVPMIAVEIELSGSPSVMYFATTSYITRSTDTPASRHFDARIAEDVSFDRSVGTIFWGQKPRGEQNFGVVTLVNADGFFDYLVGTSFRDKTLTIKRGEDGDAYSTFSTVATLVIDRAEFDGEKYLRFYVKDLSAKLERQLQTSLYPTTTTNAGIRGRPRPVTVGKCYQVPVIQPDAFGNGHFDIHDSSRWIGVDQVMDQGATLVEATGFERSNKSGIYGFERLSAIAGKQVANVTGAWKYVATEVSDDFTSLSGWTETNGGVAGRDASISSNTLSLVNTAGGADLSLVSTTTITGGDSIYFYYEFDCVTWTSGQALFRSFAALTEKTIDAVGKYCGIVRSNLNWQPRFYAINGSNCSLTIDNFRVYRVTPIEGLQDVIKYVATNDSDTSGKGPLTTSNLDTTAIGDLETACSYELAFHASEPIQIADVLDDVMASHGGWWYIDRTGKLTVGRLLAPTGTADYTFDQSSIRDMSIALDEAKGLSNVILAKRNWAPYAESELIASINYVQLNSSDKDADVTLSNSNYTYSAANAGSVRSTPIMFGERYYFEVTVSAVGAASQHYIGIGNSSATITSYPGSDANAHSYRANANYYHNGAATAFGATWTANDVIGVAIDGRPAAHGSRARHFRVYYAKNGTWQGSGNPDTEANFLAFNTGAAGVGYVMIGGNAAETNSGTVNFGQSTFTYTPPADYIAPAWHRGLVQLPYRYTYQSTTSLAAEYTHANAAAGAGEGEGIATLLSRAADAVTECDRWATLFSTARYFYTFTAFLDAGINVDQIEPGDVIEVTYPRFGLSAKKLRVIGVAGNMLARSATIKAWG